MCIYRDRCINFVESPYSSAECVVFCRRNSSLPVEVSELAEDFFVEGEERLVMKVTARKKEIRKNEIEGEKNINEEVELFDPFEVDEDERNIDLMELARRRGRKMRTREVIEEVEAVPFEEEIERMKKESKEEKTVNIKEILKKRAKVTDKITKMLKEGECPYCHKVYKNLDMHLKFCKVRKREEQAAKGQEEQERRLKEQEKKKEGEKE